MHELKVGLNADKFATFWMFSKSVYHSFVSLNDPHTLYNRLNASRLARFRSTRHVNKGKRNAGLFL